MPSVCCYFQVHQPYRLKPYRAQSVGHDHKYFNDEVNAAIVRKVADKCYLPANYRLQQLIERSQGEFRVAFSLSGVLIEQLIHHAPDALESFRRLIGTGAVELLGETYHHSLASLYDVDEFAEQVRAHTALMERTFRARPRIFRNTELIHDDRIADLVAELGFEAVLAEGADDVLAGRSPNFVYSTPGDRLKLLLKNYRLSDDVAFRFSNQAWHEYPLTADKYVSWLRRVEGAGDVVGLFMDYETFGEHQWADTGIFEFLDHFPGMLLQSPGWSFATPSEVIARYPAVGVLPFTRTVSWADMERDVSAWCGNGMQERALRQIYALGELVRKRANPKLTDTWRRLQTSDHFYYMCTKWFADGDVHAYFSPYESPYEAFINFMNVSDDFERFMLTPGEGLSKAS